MADYMTEEEQSPQVVSKQKKSSAHQWTDSDVRDLIYIPTGIPRRIDVNSTWILLRYVEDQILTNFHIVSTYFFDVISLIEKSTSFPRTFFNVILMAEKSTSFPRTFFDVILMFKKSTLFPRTFFNVISFLEISTVFLLTFFDVILMVE